MTAIETDKGTMLWGTAYPLDPSNIVDIDLTGDGLRQTALKGVCVEWGSRPPFYVVNFGMAHVVVGRHKDVFDAYLDAETFSSEIPEGPGYERFDIFNGLSSISQVDGADHDRVRKLLNPFFLPAGIKRIDGIMREMIDAQLDEIAARGGAFDCMADFAHPLVGRITLQGLLGMTEEQHAICRRMHRYRDGARQGSGRNRQHPGGRADRQPVRAADGRSGHHCGRHHRDADQFVPAPRPARHGHRRPHPHQANR
jgi:cytochrome P450